MVLAVAGPHCADGGGGGCADGAVALSEEIVFERGPRSGKAKVSPPVGQRSKIISRIFMREPVCL